MDHLTDSNTFHKRLLLGCRTCHSAHIGFNVVYKLFRNVLTGIHQKLARRTVEVVWRRQDTTGNEMKRVGKGKFGEVVKPS